MPAHFYWYHTDTVIYVKLEGDLTVQDLHTTDTIVGDMLNGSHAEHIHFIYDARHLQNLPAVSRLRTLRYPFHQRAQLAVIVGMKGALRVVAQAASLMFRAKIRYVASVEEGVAWLKQQDGNVAEMVYQAPEAITVHASTTT